MAHNGELALVDGDFQTFFVDPGQFGPKLTEDGVRFRLWAPAAKRVDLLLAKPHATVRGRDGWFTAEISGATAGDRGRTAFGRSRRLLVGTAPHGDQRQHQHRDQYSLHTRQNTTAIVT